MKIYKEINEKLTDNPLENIKIIAPLLNKREQENVFSYVMGLYSGVTKSEPVQEEPYGSEQKGE